MCSVKQAEASVHLNSTNKSPHIDNGSIILIAQIVHLLHRGKFYENLSCASPVKLMFCVWVVCSLQNWGKVFDLSSRCLEGTSGTTHPVTDYHFLEELNLQRHCCENLKSH